jgi:hypothetical protein
VIDKETLWAGSPVPVQEHDWRCKCEECITIRWLKAEKEVVALHNILKGTRQQWQLLSDDEALRLWAICKIPTSHLEDPNDTTQQALRFAASLSHALQEKNWYAFCINNREGETK